MNFDRMVFAPGDKVMRVAGNRHQASIFKGGPKSPPKFGVVYCVEDFWEGPRYNVIILVGFGGWYYKGKTKVGYYAGAFRKVEEIQLCARVARLAKAKELQPA